MPDQRIDTSQTNFGGGEYSPLAKGRTDAERYKIGLDTCQNFIPILQGGLSKRPGTYHVKEVQDSSKKTRLVEFEFSTTQAYMLEFGEQYIRVYRDQGIVTDSNATITGITQANPGVVTTSGAHGFSNGDEVFITAVVGMTELNGRFFKINNVTGTTFELQDMSSTNFDTSALTAYSSAGDAARVLEITTPYLESELFDLKFTQSADVLYIVHPSHEPEELTRTGHSSWTLSDFAFDDGPYMDENEESTTITITGTLTAGNTCTFTASATTGINGGDGFQSTDVGRWVRVKPNATWGWALITSYTDDKNVDAEVYSDFDVGTATTSWRLGKWSDTTGWPSCVTFHENRLVFAGVPDFPQDIMLSNSGDYTLFSPSDAAGSISDANAVSFTLNATGVNKVQWILSDEKGMFAGTVAGEWMIRPSSQSEALTPTNVTAKRSTTYGSADIEAVKAGKYPLFIQRAQRKIRELIYSFQDDGFNALDLSILSEHITLGGITEMAFQAEPNPIVWLVRDDGELVGVTYERETESFRVGWHRHVIGGSSDAAGTKAKVESVAVIPTPAGDADELWVITQRYINGASVRQVEYVKPIFDDATEQKDAFFVDGGLTYDAPVTITAITKADPAVVTAASHGFSDGDKVLISDVKGMTDVNTNSYLVANKTTNTFELTNLSGTNIDSSAFSTYVSGGEVRKFVSTLSGLWHLEGESLSILGDGAVQPAQTVSSGAISLSTAATTVHVGLSYNADGKQLRKENQMQTGVSLGKDRRTHQVHLFLHRSLGLKIGFDFDDLTELTFRKTSDTLSRAVPLFSGIKSEEVEGDNDQDDQFCWRSDTPLPLTVLSITSEAQHKD